MLSIQEIGLTKLKINHIDFVFELPNFPHQEIVGFYIAMEETVFMNILDSLQHLKT